MSERKFQAMHPVIQSAVTDVLRPLIAAMGADEFTSADIEDLRDMLIATAKATIDVELEKRRRRKEQDSGIVIAQPGGLL